jgi:phosphoglycerate dehydrogenase-like enzyme
MKAGGWERKQGAELEGRTLGVIGTGRIGRLVTRFALALDMKVVGHDAYPDSGYAPSGFSYTRLEDLLAQADIVTLHCPHAPGEKPLIDRQSLALMKKDARLINTARAGLVEDAAVLEALNGGTLGGYAVDAYDKEPPDASPLLAHERVISTAHIGAYTAESVSKATRAAVDNLLGALKTPR